MAQIGFTTIPSSTRKPGRYGEFNFKLASRSLPSSMQSLLLIGQRLAAGPVAAAVATDIYSTAEAEAYFGAGSVLQRMALAAIAAQPAVLITAIALDDSAAGAAASGKITLAGTATASGTLLVWIGNQKLTIGVATGDTPDVLATALVTDIANTPTLPVTAAAVAGVVTLTAKNKGALGNQIKLSTSLVVAAGFTAAVAAMAGGATDPSIEAALTAVYAKGYTAIACSIADQENLVRLKNYLDETGGPMEQRGSFGVAAMTSTLATATTLAGQINSGRITLGLLPGTKSLPWEVAAAYAAVAAGEEDPAMPLNTLELRGIAVPAVPAQLGRKEQEVALHNGVAPMEVVNDTVQIVRAVTTYTKNQTGVLDDSLLDLTTIRSLDYGRLAINTRFALRFPRSKLSSRTVALVRDELMDVLYQLEELEIWRDIDTNKDKVIVQESATRVGWIEISVPAAVVPGLHVIAEQINLLL